MKISRRELNLIITLAIAGLLYFNARIINKGTIERQALLTENGEVLGEIQNVKLQIGDVEQLTKENLDIINEIEENTKSILTDIKQEELIVLLELLNDNNNFEIVNIDFTNMLPSDFVAANFNFEEEVETTQIENIVNNYTEEYFVTMSFNSDYESIVDYVKRINDLNKSLYVTEIKIATKEADVSQENITPEEVIEAKSVLRGDMIIYVGTIKGLSDYGIENNDLDFEFSPQITEGTNPFIPYNEYIAKIVEDNRVEIQNEIVTDNEIITITDITSVQKYTNITSFEKNDFFFIGSPKDVSGSIELNKNSYSGLWSAQLNYNFVNGALENTANLVFDQDVLVLEEQVERLSLRVYSPQYSYHTIGMVILDSSGKQHDITFSDGVYWTHWNTLESSVSNDIHYPAVISRIYVKDNAEKSNLNGSYLFDDLEVLYTKDVLRGDQ